MAGRRSRKRPAAEVAPAPGDLEIVQAFVNTAGRRKHDEELTGPRTLARWLASRRLMPEAVELQAADLERAIALRDGFRALLRANSGAALDEPAVARLEQAAAQVPLRLRAETGGGVYLAPAADRAEALGRLVGLFAAARFGASWPRFKACRDPACGAAFYDATKNLSGRWCSLRCGNRHAARAWRRRKRTG